MTEEYSARWEKFWSQDGGLKVGQLWDTGVIAPALKDVTSLGVLPSSGRALVPGCGRGYDVIFFSQLGLDATGLEYSSTAADAARALISSQPDPSPGSARVVSGDFFQDNAELGQFDVIYDYTFYCAILPSMREAWGERMGKLVAKGGKLITLIFPVGDVPSEPPHKVSIEEMTQILVKNGFENIYLQPIPEEKSHKGRGGKEHLGIWSKKD